MASRPGAAPGCTSAGRYRYPSYQLSQFEQDEVFMEGWDEGEFVELETFLQERTAAHLFKKHEDKVKYVKEAMSARQSDSTIQR